mmetsp:Transcript_14072/g.35873  ORF Transcript_14072/g.35873 Transcript_14072/m.35873 type:complete len:239 (+) Transcript_14072:32-748(+)
MLRRIILPNIVEIRVLQRLQRADPLRRIHRQHLPQQLTPLLPQPRHDLVQILLPPLRILMPIPQLPHLRPALHPRRPPHLKNRQHLLDLALPGKHRRPRHHLGQNRADGPHVDGGCVVLRAEEDFRGPVPQRDDLVCVLRDGDGEDAAEAEVCDLDGAGGDVDEEVLGLEVAVHDGVGVAVAEPEEDLEAEVLGGGGVEGLALAEGGVHVLLEVVVEEFEDEVEEGLSGAAFGVDDFE